MVASSSAEGVTGARVLEIGGGIGAVQAELLSAGASTGQIVELVPSYEPYARELAREKGLEERTTFVVADLLDDPAAVEAADVVVLNRVVCCSPDGVELMSVAAALTLRKLLASYPRDVVWIRLGIQTINLLQRLRRRSFRAFVHPPAALRAAAENEGLRVSETGGTTMWEYVELRRAS
jgi:SAM-dependent methyltransferase